MLINYAENARNFPSAVIQDAQNWTGVQVTRSQFREAYPIVLDLSTWAVWDELNALGDTVCVWLGDNVGQGGMFGAFSQDDMVDWLWADWGHEIGFRHKRDAEAFCLKFGL
jgi:hypothetical protein